jgi:hypothetical protein
MQDLIAKLFIFGSSIAILLLVTILLWLVHKRLLAMYSERPAEQYRRQLIMLACSLFGLLLAIVLMPIGDAMRGQLLGLLAILLGAVIALSSTALVGNALAGLLIKAMHRLESGDCIKVGDHLGRISRQDLWNTEIQTDDGNHTVLPNLLLVTSPVTVVTGAMPVDTVRSENATVAEISAHQPTDAPPVDAARQAQELQELRERHAEIISRIEECEQLMKNVPDGEPRRAAVLEKKNLQAKLVRAEKAIQNAEADIAEQK